MKAPNGRLSGNGFVKARRHVETFGGNYPEIFSVLPQILLCSEKIVLNIR